LSARGVLSSARKALSSSLVAAAFQNKTVWLESSCAGWRYVGLFIISPGAAQRHRHMGRCMRYLPARYLRCLLLSLLLALLVPAARGAISPNQTYVLGDILPYARLAFAAYCPNPFNFTCDTCPPVDFLPVSTFYNDSTNMFAYIGIRLPQTDPPEIIIVFRGTQFSSLLNWIYNLQFPKVIPYRNYPGMAVHEGFWEVSPSALLSLMLLSLTCAFRRMSPSILA
jgi:hypothetical protein